MTKPANMAGFVACDSDGNMLAMEKKVAQCIAILLKLVPKRIAQAIFYRIPSSWFSFRTITRYCGSNISVFVGENIGRKIFFLDNFEGEQIDIFANLVNEETVFYDIGANIGVYSLVAGSRGAKVFAFEPSPDVLPYLRDNIKLNDYDITLIPEAVGDKAGSIPFYMSTKENMGQGRILPDNKRTDTSRSPVLVPVDTLDHYAQTRPFPTFIKMDIEGAELFALSGGREMLSRADGPMLMVEFHPGEIEHLGGNAHELMRMLRGHGYRQYQHKSAVKERWYIFSKQPFQMEGFSEIIV